MPLGMGTNLKIGTGMSRHFVKVYITSVGILNVCNLWILLRKIVIYLVGQKCRLHGLFNLAVKVDGSDVK